MVPPTKSTLEEQTHELLKLYADYMLGRSLTGYYPKADSVGKRSLTNFMAGEDDSLIVYERSLKSRAKAVYAKVISLPPVESAAVDHKFGLSKVWRFPKLDFGGAYSRAEATLQRLFLRDSLISLDTE